MATIEVTRLAREELRELIETRHLPVDTRERVSRSLLTLEKFPRAGNQLSGIWRDCRALIGPWGWLIVVYMSSRLRNASSSLPSTKLGPLTLRSPIFEARTRRTGGCARDVNPGFTEKGEDARVTASAPFAAIDLGIAILLLPIAALLAALFCALALILTVAMGTVALWTL